MKSYSIIRYVLSISVPALVIMLLTATIACAQEAGGDLGGGAGIFRPKNPETGRRRAAKAKTGPGSRSTRRNTERGTEALTPEVEERIGDALDAGNEARDARKYAEAERAYRSVFKFRTRAAGAVQGIGNVSVDRQRGGDHRPKPHRCAGGDG